MATWHWSIGWNALRGTFAIWKRTECHKTVDRYNIHTPCHVVRGCFSSMHTHWPADEVLQQNSVCLIINSGSTVLSCLLMFSKESCWSFPDLWLRSSIRKMSFYALLCGNKQLPIAQKHHTSFYTHMTFYLMYDLLGKNKRWNFDCLFHMDRVSPVSLR